MQLAKTFWINKKRKYLKQKILYVFYIFSYCLGINKIFYFINRDRQRIITYHNILPLKYFEANTLHLGVSHSEEVFDAHINHILKRFDITTELGKEQSCIITFDDGFRNNYTQANTILQKYNVKTYFFISLDMVINGNLLWVDKILFWISFVPNGEYTILDKKIKIDNDFSRISAFQMIWNNIYKDYSRKSSILEELENNYPFQSIAVDKELYEIRFKGMSLSEIEKMKSYGHKIGCHSMRHDILSLLEEDELDSDIAQSEKYLGTLFNTKIYSYPFGGEKEVSQYTIKQVSKSKFSSAVMNISTPHFNYGTYAIPRFSLPNTSNKYIIDAKLSGMEYFLKYKSLLPKIPILGRQE